jgi:GNAT superfamily N-acetyltransferase
VRSEGAQQPGEDLSAQRTLRELRTGESHLAHRAMRELRPGIGDERGFAERVDGVLRAGGYRLLGAFVPGGAEAVGVAGFRVADGLAWGRYLYIDDLCVSAAERRRGHGAALLEWLVAEARSLGCEALHLDSGTGPERFDAHRLYHRGGLSIYSHHFARGV